jgi:hypothetical protein
MESGLSLRLDSCGSEVSGKGDRARGWRETTWSARQGVIGADKRLDQAQVIVAMCRQRGMEVKQRQQRRDLERRW